MRDDKPTSADPPVEDDDLRAELRRRGQQIAVRIEQLRNRCRELAAGGPRSSTADKVTKAQAHALRAHSYAEQAHLRVAERHDQAAEAHLRLAVIYEQQGDPELTRAHAANAGTRAAASADRTRASGHMRVAQEEQRR